MTAPQDFELPPSLTLQDALRLYLLPVLPAHEDQAVEAARGVLDGVGLDSGDHVPAAQYLLRDWQRGEAPTLLLDLIRAYVRGGDPQLGDVLADQYFALHRRIADLPLYTHETARALLTHARLIWILLEDEQLSCAQVARVIGTKEPALSVSFQVIQIIAPAISTTPAISDEALRRDVEQDRDEEADYFADADSALALELLNRVSRAVGLRAGIGDALAQIAPPFEPVPHPPVLQMLYVICLQAEHFDHRLESLYEFSPRRNLVKEWIRDQYPPSLRGPAENPFLNNAKSVQDLSRGWAWSKSGASNTRGPAHGLVTAVELLDSISFGPRREVAAWVRRWVHRQMRLARGSETVLPDELSPQQWQAVLEGIAAANTGTRGVLEQRLVDAWAMRVVGDPNWIERGVGDSVNATNVAKRKLGDVDFQHAAGRVVRAYEPHGGTLQDIYVRSHVLTMHQVLDMRRAEWAANVGDASGWTVEVKFVCHGDATTSMPFEETILDTSVTVDSTSYRDLIADLDPEDEDDRAALTRYFLDPLRADHVPDSVRDKILELADTSA